MTKIKTGYKTGRLTAISFLGISFKYGRKRKIYLCECDCGSVIELTSDALYATKSCGCLVVDINRARFKDHIPSIKKKVEDEYRIFMAMKNRCYNINTKKYPIYGGRGIFVCEKWRNNYSEFLKDMGRRPSKNHSIDRIDVYGNYEPNNCRWATAEQQANNKTNSIYIEYLGKTLTITQWHKECGYKKSLRTFRRKLNEQGYTLSDFINQS